MCKLPKFDTHGCIHFITNNQLGYTTDSRDSRSFAHSSSIVKPFGIPILRVNTFDVEAVNRVSRLAVRYWQKWGKDVLIDMVGFRKYGHNELDEPAFTQPKMYERVRKTESLPTQYGKKLESEGIIKKGKFDKMVE